MLPVTHKYGGKETSPACTDGRQKPGQKAGIKKQQGMQCDENVRPKPAGSLL